MRLFIFWNIEKKNFSRPQDYRLTRVYCIFKNSHVRNLIALGHVGLQRKTTTYRELFTKPKRTSKPAILRAKTPTDRHVEVMRQFEDAPYLVIKKIQLFFWLKAIAIPQSVCISVRTSSKIRDTVVCARFIGIMALSKSSETTHSKRIYFVDAIRRGFSVIDFKVHVTIV